MTVRRYFLFLVPRADVTTSALFVFFSLSRSRLPLSYLTFPGSLLPNIILFLFRLYLSLSLSLPYCLIHVPTRSPRFLPLGVSQCTSEDGLLRVVHVDRRVDTAVGNRDTCIRVRLTDETSRLPRGI